MFIFRKFATVLIYILVMCTWLTCASADKKASKDSSGNTEESVVEEAKDKSEQLDSSEEMTKKALYNAELSVKKAAESLADLEMSYELKVKPASTKVADAQSAQPIENRIADLQKEQEQAEGLLDEVKKFDDENNHNRAFELANQANELAQVVLEQSALLKIEISNLPQKVAPKKSQLRIHTVNRRLPVAECLWNIAKKYYGSGKYWRKLYVVNKATIKNPSLIYPGQKIIVPYLEGEQIPGKEKIKEATPILQESTVDSPLIKDKSKGIGPNEEQKAEFGNNSQDKSDIGNDDIQKADNLSPPAQKEEEKGQDIHQDDNNKEADEVEVRVDENRLIIPRNRGEEDLLIIELEKNVDQYLLETE